MTYGRETRDTKKAVRERVKGIVQQKITGIENSVKPSPYFELWSQRILRKSVYPHPVPGQKLYMD
jgi:hypothetical protein